MKTLAHPAASPESDTHKGLLALAPQERSFKSRQAQVRSGNEAVTSRSSRLHWLVEDANGSHLVNFPFAFAVFVILASGLTAVGFGIIITSALLAGVGVITTLLACFLYGWSLCDSDREKTNILESTLTSGSGAPASQRVYETLVTIRHVATSLSKEDPIQSLIGNAKQNRLAQGTGRER